MKLKKIPLTIIAGVLLSSWSAIPSAYAAGFMTGFNQSMALEQNQEALNFKEKIEEQQLQLEKKQIQEEQQAQQYREDVAEANNDYQTIVNEYGLYSHQAKKARLAINNAFEQTIIAAPPPQPFDWHSYPLISVPLTPSIKREDKLAVKLYPTFNFYMHQMIEDLARYTVIWPELEEDIEAPLNEYFGAHYQLPLERRQGMRDVNYVDRLYLKINDYPLNKYGLTKIRSIFLPASGLSVQGYKNLMQALNENVYHTAWCDQQSLQIGFVLSENTLKTYLASKWLLVKSPEQRVYAIPPGHLQSAITAGGIVIKYQP